jgi:hypothetical protein
MARRVVAAIAIGLFVATACSVVSPPRHIIELDIDFQPAPTTPDESSRDRALVALQAFMREFELEMGRRPDRIEYGTARCHEEFCPLDRGPQPRTVWLVEWIPDGGDIIGLFMIDASSSEIVAAWNHGAERYQRMEPFIRRQRILDAPGAGAGDAQ